MAPVHPLFPDMKLFAGALMARAQNPGIRTKLLNWLEIIEYGWHKDPIPGIIFQKEFRVEGFDPILGNVGLSFDGINGTGKNKLVSVVRSGLEGLHYHPARCYFQPEEALKLSRALSCAARWCQETTQHILSIANENKFSFLKITT